ncbi:hypothetical protein CYMTET_33802 [Cymbomonas tetramitiformis]|uniref:Uncharacterized protein n=1 Tax=Cymbomonas tetramitiformis TaxID=36881 RepID=A0AAE0FCG1_9CHLO|nr:hypothetical protein CYMTET_33802 [Cymbomonas tetramitiformis]
MGGWNTENIALAAKHQSHTLTASTAHKLDDSPYLGLIVLHEPLRRVLLLVDNCDFSSTTNVVLLSKWFPLYFHKLLTCYMKAEENLFIPWLQCKSKGFVDTHVEDRKVVLGELDLIERLLSKAAESIKEFGSSTLLYQIEKKMYIVSDTLRRIMTEQEVTLPNTIRDCFTEKEHIRITQRFMKSFGWEGSKVFLPLVSFSVDVVGGYGDKFPLGSELAKRYFPYALQRMAGSALPESMGHVKSKALQRMDGITESAVAAWSEVVSISLCESEAYVQSTVEAVGLTAGGGRSHRAFQPVRSGRGRTHHKLKGGEKEPVGLHTHRDGGIVECEEGGERGLLSIERLKYIWHKAGEDGGRVHLVPMNALDFAAQALLRNVLGVLRVERESDE